MAEETDIMTFSEFAKTRESCRNYTGEIVDKEKLMRIAETSRNSPSACNSQPWHMTVVSGEEKVKAVAECTQRLGINKFTDNVGGVIVINEEKANLSATAGNLFTSQHFSGYDIGLLAAHICFAAVDEGLGSCILGMFFEKKLRKLLGINDGKKISLVIALGYSATETPRDKIRKPGEETITVVE